MWSRNTAQTYQAHYDYDRFGNRFQYQANSNLAYTPVVSSDINGANNRFISSGATPTSYDPAGNILSDAKFRGMNYSYDANGRQTFAERSDHTNQQTSVYDCAGQRVQTSANGATRQLIYDIFGQNIGDYRNGLVERENIYRGGQLLAVVEAASAAAPSGLAAAPSGGGAGVALSWPAAAGATNYRVERKGANSSYVLAATTTSTSLTDNGVSSGSAYLYRVCAADGAGNCTSTYSNLALGAAVSFPTDSTITGIADDPTGVNVTTVKAAHITELRTAVNAVRSLAGLAAAVWTHDPVSSGMTISVDDVRDLRVKLDEALTALGIQTSSYDDPSLAGAPNGTLIKKTHITQLRQRATSGSGSQGSGGTSGGLMYVLSDLQGSARAVMNNNGGGASTIIARHDYLPFGEEIGASTGLRTSAQGYGASDTNRRKYALTERDDATGLDHTWWRKYESLGGRWTSPDPYRGSMTIVNPQSFNGYNYVQNDPVNFLDPTGLCLQWLTIISGYHYYINGHYAYSTVESVQYICITPDPSPRVGSGINQRPKKEPNFVKVAPKGPPTPKTQAEKQRDYLRCLNRQMRDLNIELNQLMNENLDLMVGGDILALPISPIGLNGYNLLSLVLWQLQLTSFNKRYEPARQKAMKTCRKEAGLD